jgi:A/G-specific adenine glycosylase
MRAAIDKSSEPGLASSPAFSTNLPAFRRALLRWYELHRRDLPWRHTSDPYRIWLSEVMLQQTRVAAVLEHYRVFLERFPDVQTLAAASEDQVLAAWSGLGYYRRARMLHQCAIMIVQEHSGVFPQTSAAMLALPGIGRYTSAAIASIAFSEPIAVVDGNVERVLRRVTGKIFNAAQAWNFAQQFLAKSRPGDFNQAMMELGATVCVPRTPQCSSCPVRKWCATRGEVPRSVPRIQQQKKQTWCSLEQRNGNANGNIYSQTSKNESGRCEVRLVQRSKNNAVMAGMWELPQSSDPPSDLPDSAVWRTFRHCITVTDYSVHVLRNNRQAGKRFPNALRGTKGKWIAADRIQHIPVTGLTRKILKASGII